MGTWQQNAPSDNIINKLNGEMFMEVVFLFLILVAIVNS